MARWKMPLFDSDLPKDIESSKVATSISIFNANPMNSSDIILCKATAAENEMPVRLAKTECSLSSRIE
jgi:hypothetical protein